MSTVPKKPRRIRTDSPEFLLDVAATAGTSIEPPASVTLRPGDRPFFDALTPCRAPADWNEADLVTCAHLARAHADVERLTGELAIEGDTVSTASGGVKLNPKHGLLESKTGMVLRLTRLLGLTAKVRLGTDPRTVANRAHAHGELRATFDASEDDDLLAKPGLQ